MGEVQVPADALWRAQTQRAVENFPISGSTLEPAHVRALAQVKAAAAKVNAELGVVDETMAAAIRDAAAEVADGRHDDHFPVDVFQTGSGTSSNMNMNEVLASLAQPRRGRRTPQRPRQRQPVQQRHLPDLDPRGRDRGDHPRPGPRPGPPRSGARGQGRGVQGRRQGRPDPPDGRHAGDARPGARRVRRRGPARHRAARVGPATGRGAPPRRYGGGHRDQHPRGVRGEGDRGARRVDGAAVHRGPRTTSRHRARATLSWSSRASCARSR